MNTIDLSRHTMVARGALAPPFFTWLAMVTFAIVFYTLTAAAPMLGETTWIDAARLGTGWWMTAFGGEMVIGDAAISLMPLTITFIAVRASYVTLRRRGVATWGEVAAAGLGPAALVAVLGLLIRPEGSWWPAIIGGCAIGTLSALFAARYSLIYLPWLDGAARRIRVLLAVIALLAVGLFILAVIMGWSRIMQVHGYYLAGAVGSVGLVLFQLAYLPVGVVWALAWLLGAGFAVGAGTEFSVLGVTSAPLPAIPILGALPQVSDGMPWVLAVAAMAFAILGAVSARREDAELGGAVARAVIAAMVVAFTVAVFGLLATGAIGPGRMAELGPVPAELFGFTLLLIGLPYVLGSLAAHPQAIAWVRIRVGNLKSARDERHKNDGRSARARQRSTADGAQPVTGDDPASGDDQPPAGSDKSVSGDERPAADQ